jgi:alanine racemase
VYVHTTWCEISSAALESNARVLKARLSPGTRLGVVVKSDAYGHGITLAASAFLRGGADWLIVNAIEEAVQLRHASIAAPIYVCGFIPEEAYDKVLDTSARVVLFDTSAARALSAVAHARGVKVGVHIKLETGTNRQGLLLPQALELGRLISTLPGLTLEGLTTHFADIEDSTNHAFAKKQIEQFDLALAAFREAGLTIPVPHVANSAATLLYPNTHAGLVRTGIASYGLWPSKETFATALQRQADGVDKTPATLTPALAWRARIIQVKDVASGSYVGYGRTYRTTHPTRIAVLPLGYYEGYDRRLSNAAHVLVLGQRAPVRGRICMNMFMIDVTHIPEARAGSTATLLGRDGEEEISAEQLASWMGTINYEAVCRIHPSVPRIEG